MVEKIHMIQTRVEELKDLIYKARNGQRYGDIQWLESLLVLNNRILTHLLNGFPVHFYKVQYTDENAKGFFLTRNDVTSPFLDIQN